MFSPSATPLRPSRLLRTLRAVILTVIGLAVAIGITDTAIGWMIGLTLVGGGLTGGLLLFARPRRHAAFSVDSFARGDLLGDVMNLSRVRVAGLGGVGLLIVAALVALQFPLISVVLAAGAVGGAMAGAAVILYRRGRRSSRASAVLVKAA